MDFERNVFINCPYDKEYFEILKPIVFTIITLGFNPRLALENSDSGVNRIERIYKLICESQYSIHDLSRLISNTKKEFYRLNMPFELGIDFGCRKFSSDDKYRNKRFLILEKNLHDYKKALSDISGMDIKSHSSDPLKAISQVRNWFCETVGINRPPAATRIWEKYMYFNDDFYQKRIKEGFSKDEINELPIIELMSYMQEWIATEELIQTEIEVAANKEQMCFG